MNWLIIGGLIILAFLFLRVKHMKHKVFLVLVIVALLFFYGTGYKVLSGQDINWRSVKGVEKGARIYVAWLGGVFGNVRSLTANAIKMDWKQENRTDNAIRIVEEKQK